MQASRLVLLSFLLLSPLPACVGEAPDDPVPDRVVREVRGGRFHHAALGAADAPDGVAELLPLIAGELADVVAPLGADDFQVAGRRELAGPNGSRLIALSLQQVAGGVPIRGARLDLTLRPAAGDTVLVASSYRLYHDADVDLDARIGRDQAVDLARAGLRARGDAAVVDGRLGIELVDGRMRLAWSMTVDGDHHRAVVLASGDDAGRVLVIDERVWASGVVHGRVSPGAPGRAGSRMVPLVDLRVRSTAAQGWTDEQGAFSIDVAAGDVIRVGLDGRAVQVLNVAGPELEATAEAGSGLQLELADSGAEQAVAQTNAYQVITAARRWLLAAGAAEDELGAAVTARVNENDHCNAYYSTTSRSLHFFRAGGGCRNSAEPSIIAHEYGHLADDAFGGITDDGLSEGWGDLLACFLLGEPEVGADLLGDGILRSCDNRYRYPRSGDDEVHALGQAWSGFAWDVRAGLIERHGDDAGAARARELLLPVLTGNAADIPAAVRQAFLLDDDNGDLDDGTPSWDILIAAAGRHDLGFVIGEEQGPPAAVRDLAAAEATATRVTLRWTAPGDDGRTGQATRYNLRWASRRITAATFAAATPVPVPAPRPAGTAEQVTVAVPPIGEVWFALRSWDDAGNVSTLSNVPSVRLAEPVRLFADGAENGLGGWSATGLWHVTERTAAAGDHSFWYGDEVSGHYDVDGARVGALVSPIIDLGGTVAPVLAFAERVDVEDHPERDLATVTVVDIEDRVHMVAAGKLTGWTEGEFRARLLDLAPLAGRKVRIEIVFDTVDGVDNQRGGWFVDELQVVADDGPAPAGQLVINEILADPPAGFDCGGDGAWSYRDDEMVELVNGGGSPVDLSGASVEDGIGVRLTFPAGTAIAPGGVLVVLGGGEPNVPGVIALAAPGGLQLNNDGDVVRVRAAGGQVLAEVAYGPEGGLDQSLVRSDDGNGQAGFVLHRSIATTPASPGRRSDGTPF